MKVTYHFSVERKNRIDFINKTVGFGEDIATNIFLSESRAIKTSVPTKSVLTSTGIIKIFSIDDNTLITAYIATIGEGTAIYRKCHNVKRCPDWLMNQLCKNQYLLDRCPQ